MSLGLFLFFYASLTGFFAFAAIYHFVLWWSARREPLLVVFSADCCIRAAFSAALVVIASSTTPEEAHRALRAGLALGMLMTVTWVWSLSLVSGVRARWFIRPITVLFLLLFPLHTFVAALNPPVLSLEPVVAPWGEQLIIPRSGPPGWWFYPLSLVVVAIELFGGYCGLRLRVRDRPAGALVLLVVFGMLSVHAVELARGLGWWPPIPYVGVVPMVVWVCVIALLLARRHQHTHNRLTVSEERFRTLAEEASDGIFIVDPSGRCRDANPTGCQMLGYTRSEMLTLSVADFVIPEERERIAADLARLRTAGAIRSEWRFRRKDATVFEGEVNAWKLPDERLLGVVRDVTERKRADRALRESEERFRTLVENAPEAIVVFDVGARRFVDVNEKAVHLFGLSRAELLRTGPVELSPPVQPDGRPSGARAEELIGRAVGGEAPVFEWVHRSAAGTDIPCEVRLVLLPASGRTLVRGSLTDITQRKRAEEELRASEARLSAVIANSPGVAVQWYDRDGRVVLWNRASEEMYGYPAGEAVGRTLDQLTHTPEGFREFLEDLATIQRTGRPIEPTEYRFRHRTGAARLCLSTLFPIPGPNGADWFVCMDVDITERRGAEETIRQILAGTAPTTGRDFFQALATHLGRVCRVDCAFIAVLDPRDANTVRSVAVARRGEPGENLTYSLPKTPCENVTTQGFCHYPAGVQRLFPDDPLLVQMGIESYMGIPLKSRSGRPLGLIVLMHGRPLERPQQAETILRVVAARAAAELERELAETARREAEQTLRERETFLRLAQEAAHVGSWEWDVPTNRFKWSDELARMHGTSTAEFDGTPATVLSFYDPEDAARLQEATTAAFADGGARAFECRTRRPDGTVRDLWFLGRSHRDERGVATKVLGIAIDITERKRAEETRRVLEAQLAQAQKMEAVGRLAGGVAHDFNNLLTVITGFSGLLRRREADGSNRAMLDGIQDACERAAALTRQLLTFSRQQLVEPRIIDLNVVVADTGRMLERLIGEDVRLETVLHPDVAPVRADPGQIGQVLMNLAVNARDAMPRGGVLTVETGNAEIDETFVHLHPEARPGHFAVLAVTDTGSGMSRDVLARIFEPFFTTKGPGKGTGLGLATVRTIAEQCGGFMSVYSEPARGSTFRLYLPALAEPARTEGPDAPGPALPGGTETILLVEDDDSVRLVTRRLLEQFGYTVVEAAGGAEALGLVERHTGALDLLVTDVVMPELNGRELAEILVRMRPGLKVLYLSGYTDDAVVAHGVLHADVAFLQKPFTMDALARKVRHTLDAPPHP